MDHELFGGLVLAGIVFLVFVYFSNGKIDRKEREEREQREINKKRLEDAEQEKNEHGKKHTEFIKSAKDKVHELIAKHISTLATKQAQTISQDEYGNYLVDRWIKEIDYFIGNVLRKEELISDFLFDSMIETFSDDKDIKDIKDDFVEMRNDRLEEIRKMVIDAVYEYQIRECDTNPSIDVNILDPIQFEYYCADILTRSGWKARVTQISGDQGIDIIANVGDVKLVLQCKKYSQPVGNSAVQEIIAGKQFEKASIAAVVSNNSYTPSAKQLANVAGVHLLHYSELEQFALKLFMETPENP